jgi:transcriptional regulator with XRE-family HTH domain
MGRNNKTARRTPAQGRADRASADLANKLGRMLKDGRARMRLTQQRAADAAGISRGRWADLEGGRDALATVMTLNRAAFAIGGGLDAWIKETSAADQPRDAVHLRHQELIIRLGLGGGWKALPEEMIDREARTSRAADVLLDRTAPDGTEEYALWDVWDWFPDVGGPVRDFSRRLEAVERYAVARMRGLEATLPRVSGCWVVRATARNRRLIAEPGSGHAWLAALIQTGAPLPKEPALIWVAVNGERLFPARLG